MRRVVLFAVVALAAPVFASNKDYQMPVQLTPELVSSGLDPALMCLAAYTDSAVSGWNGPELSLGPLPLDDLDSGFHACLYQRESDGVLYYWLAFRGTDLTRIEDWMTNYRQNVLGQVPEQYRLAFLRTQQLKAIVLLSRTDGRKAEIGLTGHSLGAGLAAFSGLCWALQVTCFASAPLAAGAEKQIEQTGLVGLRRAPEFVIHYFIKGDRVPDLAALLGGHFGRLINPELRPPDNLSGVDTERQRMNLLMVAGLTFDKSKLLRRASSINTVVDIVARHSMANYITALMRHASPTGGAPTLAGCWRSRGSFFQISSNETAFILHANGTLTLQNEIVVLGGRSRSVDNGYWTFDGRTLRVTISNFATMNYVMMGSVDQRGISWRRTSVIPDEVGFMRNSNSQKDGTSAGALLLLRGLCYMMQDKDVAWMRSDRDLFSELFQ